jgi:hypothetical protein
MEGEWRRWVEGVMVAGGRITGSCSSRCRFPHLLTGASVRKRRSSGAEGRAADPADGGSARCGRWEGRAAAATWLVAARPNLRPVDRTCAGAARTATPRWRRSERRTRPAPARRRRARGRGSRPRPVTAGSPSSISPRRQQVPIRVAFGPPGQASICLWSLSVFAIAILRGLARSATGILSVSTPAS